MSARRRRGGRDDHGGGGHEGGHERWLVSYADMITLLMALFVILFALGRLDLEKLEQFREGFNAGVSNAGIPGSGPGVLDGGAAALGPEAGRDAASRPGTRSSGPPTPEALQERISTELDRQGLRRSVRFRVESRGLVISVVTDDVLFELGRADLRPDGQRVLDGLASVITEIPNDIVVEGHTDNRPISSAQFPSNWELSTDRATTVLRYLLDRHGFEPKRLSAAGYADQRPLVPHTTEANRALNRRVEVIIVTSKPTSAQPASSRSSRGAGVPT